MPIIKSAKKRVRVAQKAAIRNSKTKRAYRSSVKAFQASLTSGKEVAKSHSQAVSDIDKAVKKNVLHPNTAARKKASLAKQAKAAGKVVAVKGSGAKKAAPKKTAKPVTKKPVAKKSAAKKAPAKK